MSSSEAGASLLGQFMELRDTLKRASKAEDVGKLTAALKALGELPVDVAAIKQSKIASTVKKITEIPMDLEFKPLAVQLLAKWRSTAVQEHKADSMLNEPAPVKPPVLARQASESDEYDCRVCCDLMVDPCTLHCGHTCCRPCLFRWLKNCEVAKCPAGCTTKIPRLLPKVNILVRDKIERTFPKKYKERKEESDASILGDELEEYKKMDEEQAVENKVEEDEEKHQAVQEFIGSLMAQTQWTLVHAEERLRSRKFKHARVGPSIHYRLAGAGSGGGGGKGVVKFVVSSSPNGCLRFSARFGRAAPEQFERMVELANWVNSHHTTASMQVNPDTAQVSLVCSILIDHVLDEEKPFYMDRALDTLHSMAFQWLPAIIHVDAGEPGEPKGEGEGAKTEPEAVASVYRRFSAAGAVPLQELRSISVLASAKASDFLGNNAARAAARAAEAGGAEGQAAVALAADAELDNPITGGGDEENQEMTVVGEGGDGDEAKSWLQGAGSLGTGAALALQCGLCGGEVQVARPADYAAHVTSCLQNVQMAFAELPTLSRAKSAEQLAAALPGGQVVKGYPKCPGGHFLSAFRTPKSTSCFNCDVCAARVPQDTISFSCRLCDYDACSECYEGKLGGVPGQCPLKASAALAATLNKAEQALKAAGIRAYEKIVCSRGAASAPPDPKEEKKEEEEAAKDKGKSKGGRAGGGGEEEEEGGEEEAPRGEGDICLIRFYLRGGEVRPLLVVSPKALVWYMYAGWEVPREGTGAVIKQAAELNCRRIYGNWEVVVDEACKASLRFRVGMGFEPAAAAAASISAASLGGGGSGAGGAAQAAAPLPNFKPLLINYFKVAVQTFRQDCEALGQTAAEQCSDMLFACRAGSLEKVKELLDLKADVNKIGKDQHTALMAAAFRGFQEIVELLLDAGADVDHLTRDGHGALQMACFSRHEEVALLLCKKCGFQTLNNADEEGETPLLDASRMGLIKVVRVLVDKGVKLDHKNKKGQSALSLAMAAKQQEVVNFLLEHLGPYAAIEAAALAAAANQEPTARTTAESSSAPRRARNGSIIREPEEEEEGEAQNDVLDVDQEDPERPLADQGRDLNTQ